MPMAMMMIIMVIMTFPMIMFMKKAMIMVVIVIMVIIMFIQVIASMKMATIKVVIVMMFVVFSWRDHSVGPQFVIAPGAGDCVFVFMGTTAIVLPLSRQ
jgi:hypothetical protein